MAEHDNATIDGATFNAVTAALQADLFGAVSALQFPRTGLME